MRLLQLLFIFALLSLPFMLHLALNTLPELPEFLLSILSDYLLSIGILIFDRLLLSFHLSLLSLILLGQSPLELLLGLFLLFIEFFPLLANAITDIFLNLALTLTDFLLTFALCLFFRVFKLMVIPSCVRSLTLSIPAQPDLAIIFKSISSFIQVLFLLVSQLLQFPSMFSFKGHLFILDFIAQ